MTIAAEGTLRQRDQDWEAMGYIPPTKANPEHRSSCLPGLTRQRISPSACLVDNADSRDNEEEADIFTMASLSPPHKKDLSPRATEGGAQEKEDIDASSFSPPRVRHCSPQASPIEVSSPLLRYPTSVTELGCWASGMIEALKDWDAAPSMMLIETLRMLAVAAVRSLLVNMKYTSMGVYNLTSKKLLSATDEASLASTCRQLQAVVRPRNRHQASIVAARAAADIASFPSQRPVAETCLSPIVLNEYRHSLREQQNSAPTQGDRDDLLQQRKQLFTAPLDLELQLSEVKSLSIHCRIIGNYCQPFFERYAAFNGAAAGDRAGLERGHVHKELKERAAQTPAPGPFIAFLGGLTGCSPLDESRQLRLETVVPVVVKAATEGRDPSVPSLEGHVFSAPRSLGGYTYSVPRRPSFPRGLYLQRPSSPPRFLCFLGVCLMLLDMVTCGVRLLMKLPSDRAGDHPKRSRSRSSGRCGV